MSELQELLSAYLARPLHSTRSPMDFALYASGGAYQTPRHLKLINEKLVQVASGQITRLIVEGPPRHGKSWLVSKYFPPWFIGTHPDQRIIFTTYEAEFAAKWGLASKSLLEEHGKRVFGVQLNPDSAAAARWDLLGHEGGMVSVGTGGPVTGKGANVFIIEDPIKNAEQANSPAQRESLWTWFQSVAFTRLEPGAAIIVMGARWHEDDVTGRLLASGEPWEVVRLPAIAEDDDLLGRLPGEALWPERYSVEDLEAIKRTVGSYVWAALYQQSPVPVGGNIIQRSWFRYWQPKDSDFPPVRVRLPDGSVIEQHAVTLPELDELVQSWDLSFKESTSSDYVVGQVWGFKKADRYLLDQDRARMDFPKTLQAFRQLTAKWPRATRKLVEEKANGAALIASLNHEIPGIIPINPTIDKVSRVHAVTPQIESGNVYIPHPHYKPWVENFIAECVSFPSAKYDDAVDSLTQALNWFSSRGIWKQTPLNL
jgi:predicted phage terminase large subunit-like protein